MRPFAKLPGGRVFGLRFLPCRKAHASARPPVIFSQELNDAIETAIVSTREAGEDGPRVMFIINSLGGAFIFNREDAECRIRKGFPELSDEAVARGLRYLETRARVAASPTPSARRRENWVLGWMER